MTENVNIQLFTKLDPPKALKERLPPSSQTINLIRKTRQEIKNILDGKDKRLLCIVGPCSIHNIEEALEYGKKLKKIASKVNNKLLIVMRVYFEKPRTTIGWKGLINDPNLDGSCHVNYGLFLARRLLLDLNQLGLPCGYEMLDTITPQYISDLISWSAIGARTTESQVHRQLVSGVSMPVGFKNGTGGSKKLAADAVLSAQYPHCFMGITNDGQAAICWTLGNHHCHIILRGGSKGPNYSSDDIEEAKELLRKNKVPQNIMIDCSHGNSWKDYRNQPKVLREIIKQNRKNIIGFMLESNLKEGNQKLIPGIKPAYGISITDSCMSIETTEELLMEIVGKLS